MFPTPRTVRYTHRRLARPARLRNWAGQTFREASARLGNAAERLPLPALLRRHLSKGDAAFILAAYAIPLPGTGLVAAALVGGKLGCRHLHGRWTRRIATRAYGG